MTLQLSNQAGALVSEVCARLLAKSVQVIYQSTRATEEMRLACRFLVHGSTYDGSDGQILQ